MTIKDNAGHFVCVFARQVTKGKKIGISQIAIDERAVSPTSRTHR